MKVVIGLGNPGPRYAATRHNLGFMVVDRLERDLDARAEPAAFPGLVSRGRVTDAAGREPVLLVRPLTFMNQSGRAAAALAAGGAPGFTPGETLVVLDDVYLPFGRLRLRSAGSDGGHNGLRSILESLQTEDLPRLRCGVGPLPEGADLVEYVLEEFTAGEAESLPGFVERAAEAARAWLEAGPVEAMNRYNR